MSASSEKKLFPPYLNRGSYGGAVDKLHVFLDALGFGDGIIPDLRYGDVTAQQVAKLQHWLGIEQDGNFGPATREALWKKTSFDVDAINWAPQDGVTVWVDPNGQRGIWPE